MKPILMRHVESIDDSFKCWTNGNPHRHNPWHYHPEIEISYVAEGSGMLFLGDNIINYRKHDLILIGKNIPHEWRSDRGGETDDFSISYAIHFKESFMGKDFVAIPEAIAIKKLLDQSHKCLKIVDEQTKKRLRNKLVGIQTVKGIERVNHLLSILEVIALAPNNEPLVSEGYINSIVDHYSDRIYSIYKHVMHNFKNKIVVDDVAVEMNMTTPSFCRFFKQRTNKSFLTYVNEIRIGYACKLLHSNLYTISQVAFQSGFDNLSNFNKQFKKIKKITPSEYLALTIANMHL